MNGDNMDGQSGFTRSNSGLCVHLRAALHNDTTHSIDATVTHVHTLILDLDHPALEVLLVEQHDLRRENAGGYTRGQQEFYLSQHGKVQFCLKTRATHTLHKYIRSCYFTYLK